MSSDLSGLNKSVKTELFTHDGRQCIGFIIPIDEYELLRELAKKDSSVINVLRETAGTGSRVEQYLDAAKGFLVLQSIFLDKRSCGFTQRRIEDWENDIA